MDKQLISASCNAQCVRKKIGRLKNRFGSMTKPVPRVHIFFFFFITDDFSYYERKSKCGDTKMPALIFNFIRQTCQQTQEFHFLVLSCYTTQTIVHLTNADGRGFGFISPG